MSDIEETKLELVESMEVSKPNVMEDDKKPSNKIEEEDTNKNKKNDEDSIENDESAEDKDVDENEDIDDLKDEEEEEDEDESESGEVTPKKKGVALLDQPLTTDGKRNRKSISRYVDASCTPSDKQSPEKTGRGMELKDIPFIADNINRLKIDYIPSLYMVLFGRVAASGKLKKNIRTFNGFNFEKDDSRYMNKQNTINKKMTTSKIYDVMAILGLTRASSKSENIDILMNFLMKPKDLGKKFKQMHKKYASRKSTISYNSQSDGSDEEESVKENKKGSKKSGKKSKVTKKSKTNKRKSKAVSEDEESEEEEENTKPSKKKSSNKRMVDRDESEEDIADEISGSEEDRTDEDEVKEKPKKSVKNKSKGSVNKKKVIPRVKMKKNREILKSLLKEKLILKKYQTTKNEKNLKLKMRRVKKVKMRNLMWSHLVKKLQLIKNNLIRNLKL